MALSAGKIYASGSFAQNAVAIWAFKNNGINLSAKSVSFCPGASGATSIHLNGSNQAEWTGKISYAWEDAANWLLCSCSLPFC